MYNYEYQNLAKYSYVLPLPGHKDISLGIKYFLLLSILLILLSDG